MDDGAPGASMAAISISSDGDASQRDAQVRPGAVDGPRTMTAPSHSQFSVLILRRRCSAGCATEAGSPRHAQTRAGPVPEHRVLPAGGPRGWRSKADLSRWPGAGGWAAAAAGGGIVRRPGLHAAGTVQWAGEPVSLPRRLTWVCSRCARSRSRRVL